MRPVSNALALAVLVCIGVVSFGAACAEPTPRKDPCESACEKAEDDSCQRCQERERREERRRRESPPPEYPPLEGGGIPGSY